MLASFKWFFCDKKFSAFLNAPKQKCTQKRTNFPPSFTPNSRVSSSSQFSPLLLLHLFLFFLPLPPLLLLLLLLLLLTRLVFFLYFRHFAFVIFYIFPFILLRFQPNLKFISAEILHFLGRKRRTEEGEKSTRFSSLRKHLNEKYLKNKTQFILILIFPKKKSKERIEKWTKQKKKVNLCNRAPRLDSSRLKCFNWSSKFELVQVRAGKGEEEERGGEGRREGMLWIWLWFSSGFLIEIPLSLFWICIIFFWISISFFCSVEPDWLERPSLDWA